MYDFVVWPSESSPLQMSCQFTWNTTELSNNRTDVMSFSILPLLGYAFKNFGKKKCPKYAVKLYFGNLRDDSNTVVFDGVRRPMERILIIGVFHAGRPSRILVLNAANLRRLKYNLISEFLYTNNVTRKVCSRETRSTASVNGRKNFMIFTRVFMGSNNVMPDILKNGQCYKL